MVKSGLRVTKVSDGRIKINVKQPADIKDKYGVSVADALRRVAESGRALNKGALMAILTVKGSKLSTLQAQKEADKVLGNKVKTPLKNMPSALGNKASKMVDVVNVKTKQGIHQLEQFVAGLAEKLGVSKELYEKNPIKVRVAENEAEGNMGTASAFFDKRERTVGYGKKAQKIIEPLIVVNHKLLKDLTENAGEQAGGVIIHELGHYLVSFKKEKGEDRDTLAKARQRSIASSQGLQERNIALAKLAAEEMAVECLRNP